MTTIMMMSKMSTTTQSPLIIKVELSPVNRPLLTKKSMISRLFFTHLEEITQLKITTIYEIKKFY